MKELDPALLLSAYAAGIFPMADARDASDLFWVEPERRAILAQLLRFLISGALVTLLGVAVYALVALVLRWHPQVGNLLAYAVAMATGYWMHSRWSFRDHGERDRSTAVKFVIVSLISLGLNSLWVYLITGPLGLGQAAGDARQVGQVDPVAVHAGVDLDVQVGDLPAGPGGGDDGLHVAGVGDA